MSFESWRDVSPCLCKLLDCILGLRYYDDDTQSMQKFTPFFIYAVIQFAARESSVALSTHLARKAVTHQTNLFHRRLAPDFTNPGRWAVIGRSPDHMFA